MADWKSRWRSLLGRRGAGEETSLLAELRAPDAPPPAAAGEPPASPPPGDPAARVDGGAPLLVEPPAAEPGADEGFAGDASAGSDEEPAPAAAAPGDAARSGAALEEPDSAEPAAEAPPAEPRPPESPAEEPAPAPRRSREEDLELEIRELREQARRLGDALAREREARARLEDEVRALADQDPLTGLASARRFNDRLGVAVVQAQRYRQKLGVVQLGLDNFAAVNERLGRSHGDDLLRSVGMALEGTLRQSDTVARLGGDVFTVLLPGIKRDEDVTVIADKLRLALRSPFSIGGHDLLVTASLGIALFPDDGPDTDSLLQSATVSMQRAKQRGGDAWDVHAPRTRALAAERQERESALRRALVQGELELYWQPVVACETGEIRAMESLLRWRNPRGLESAADFVSLVDVSGLAVPLGQWTLRAACQQARRWHDAGYEGLVVSVNVSVRQLAHAALVRLVRRVLEDSGVPPSCLELEVSEAELARGAEIAIDRLGELRRLGLRVALDDFGTGDSKLAHLYRYPLDTLKIDGSVVRDAASNRDHEAVIAAAVALARSRKLRVVAEGVESEAQRVLLVRWQCDSMQGNFCGAPVGPAEAEALLLRQRRASQPEAGQGGSEPRRLL